MCNNIEDIANVESKVYNSLRALFDEYRDIAFCENLPNGGSQCRDTMSRETLSMKSRRDFPRTADMSFVHNDCTSMSEHIVCSSPYSTVQIGEEFCKGRYSVHTQDTNSDGHLQLDGTWEKPRGGTNFVSRHDCDSTSNTQKLIRGGDPQTIEVLHATHSCGLDPFLGFDLCSYCCAFRLFYNAME